MSRNLGVLRDSQSLWNMSWICSEPKTEYFKQTLFLLQRKKTRENFWDRFWGVYLFTSLTYPSKATSTTPDSYNLLQRILIGWSDVHYEPARLGLPLICCTRFEASGVAIIYLTNVEEILGRDPRTDFHLEFIQRKKLLLLRSTSCTTVLQASFVLGSRTVVKSPFSSEEEPTLETSAVARFPWQSVYPD